MHRLIPEFIQEKHKTAERHGSFYAGVIFVDITGFTPITEALMGHGQHGAEVLASIIRDVFDPLIRSVYEYGGFVTNLAGDAFTAVFPTDGASLEALECALAAVWQLQQVMAVLGQRRTPYGSFALSVKVGLAAGEVAWGILSAADGSRSAYYFRGPAIDGCTQTEKLAQAGEVIVDAAVYQALKSLISVEPVGNHFRIISINATLTEPQALSIGSVDPDIVGRFFPPEVIEHSGEFRQVTSMFVSLPTVRTEEQIGSFLQIVFDLQDRYGGLLNRLDFGDKGANLLLFWGAPITYENDITRALNFILDLQAQTVIPVNAGITYGIAHAGYSGGELAGEYTCHGRGVTLAARLMQASPRGEIWVDSNVAERAEHHFEVDFEGEIAFKGFSQKQKVFVLLDRKEGASLFFGSKMVGRQGEQAKLVDFVQPLWQGRHPGAMVIWGEPGIGKSRLAHGLIHYLKRTADHDFSVFICQTDEILRESLNPFRYWLRSYFGQTRQQSDARNKRSFNRQLDRLIAASDDEILTKELDRTRSFLGALVNLYWPDSLYEQLNAHGRYENSFTALLSLLKAESMQQPVILLIEDAHWLDDDSKEFLARLMQMLAQDLAYSIAVIATARPEVNRSVFGEPLTIEEINLGQMSPSSLAALAENHLDSPIESGLLQLLVERANGNPFFAEQILRYLQEQALTILVNGKWQLKDGQTDALPIDVRTVLVARLDRLASEVKEVVQTASVLGREFEIKLLARILQDDPTVRDKVMEAEHASIWTALNELRYIFNHTLLRDTAYQMQALARRESLHKRAAQALEELYEDDLSPYYGELAYHTERAGLTDNARRYLELAGRQAKDAYQNKLALDYFCRALKLMPAEALESRYQLLRAREELYHVQGARAEQEQDQEAMSQIADRLGDSYKQIQVLIRKAWLDSWVSDYVAALEAAQRGVTLAEEAGEISLAGQAHYAVSWILLQKHEQGEAREQIEAALMAARRSGDLQGEGNGLNMLGLMKINEGDYFEARGYLAGFLDIARELRDRGRECIALHNLGVTSVPLGDYDAAQDYFEQSLHIARQIGDQSYIGSAHINLCWLAAAQGRWESAVKQGELGVMIKREIKETDAEAEGLLWLGHAWLGLGQAQKALAAYERSLLLRRELDQEHLAMGVLAGMARAALAQDDLDRAGRHITEILSYLDDDGSLDGTWEPLRIYLTCYQVLEMLQDPRAGEILETAYQRLLQQADRIPEQESRRRFLERVPWNRDILAAYGDMNA